MFPPEKIEAWILEAQERSSSAGLIIQYIANRLRDLTEWNEKLRMENLELRSGKRVEEYERQITHLEYQLELLTRQVRGELDLNELAKMVPKPVVEANNLLVYGSQGRIARLEAHPANVDDGGLVCHFKGFLKQEGEPPRCLVVPYTEELLLIFTSGRIVTLPVTAIQASEAGENDIDWEQVNIPAEPNLGETLACVVPVSKMALADFFLQVSRRGYIKKIRTALAPTIMENKYIGTGVKMPADQTLTLLLGRSNEHVILVSYEGYIQLIPEELLSFAIVEAMRVGKTDHLVAAFWAKMGKSIVVMTQIGKVIHRVVDSLGATTDLQRKGQMLYTTNRREAGVRVIGAAMVEEGDWGFALHQDGHITLHAISELIGKGSIEVHGELLDFITIHDLSVKP